LLQIFDFPVVFFDEASMATEAASIIPLTKGVRRFPIVMMPLDKLTTSSTDITQCSHLAIIGDHKQLPPVVISPDAKAGGFARSLFERLIQPKNSSGELRTLMHGC
jgi:superfamily I DNA and/or RNA helicase